MNNQGWIKLHRQIKENSFYKRSTVVHLFIHLLLSANKQKERFYWNGKEIDVDAGQLITGLYQLSNDTGISLQTIRTALGILKSTSTITIKSTNKFSLITIAKWQDYQLTLTSTSTSKLTNNQQTTNKQLTTNNNEKNEENEKNNTLVEKITKWAYKRARVNPSCSEQSFRKSVNEAISKLGGARVFQIFSKEDNAIQFLKKIKNE